MKHNFSYFEACLKIYLTQYHPLSADDITFIEERAKESEITCKKLISEGISYHTAYDIAIDILFDGLEFSPYHILYDLICRDYKEIPINNRRKVALTLLPDSILSIESHPQYKEWQNRGVFEKELTVLVNSYLFEEQNRIKEE